MAHYRVAGYTFAFTGPEAEVRSANRGFRPANSDDIAACVYRVAESRDGLTLFENDVEVCRTDNMLALRQLYFESLQQRFIDNATACAVVHAAVVVVGSSLIVLPGRTRAGKSTLTAALLRAGARYYSDELAIVDECGRVEAFPRPLVLRETSPVDLDDGGHPVGGPPMRATHVVFTHYEPDARWSPTRLTAAEALMELVPQTVTLQSRPEFTMHALTRLTSHAVCLKTPRGEAATVAGQVIALTTS